MCGLADKYNELKEIILHRTTQHFNLDPPLPEKWDPTVMVLNKVAADNISDLFPTDWHPRPLSSSVQEKHFKVLTEIMTRIFLQCGLLIEADIIEMDNYQDFLKVLHHHAVMGNISTTQVTHFIMLTVYVSFCRLKHYTKHIGDRNHEILKQ